MSAPLLGRVQNWDWNGIQATRHIVQMSLLIGILILTVFVDGYSIFASIRASARGYLVKGAGRAEMMRAIQTVDSHGVTFSSTIAMQVMKYFEHMYTDTKKILNEPIIIHFKNYVY